jgi:prolipoprotein diacylglyceryltransferase
MENLITEDIHFICLLSVAVAAILYFLFLKSCIKLADSGEEFMGYLLTFFGSLGIASLEGKLLFYIKEAYKIETIWYAILYIIGTIYFVYYFKELKIKKTKRIKL